MRAVMSHNKKNRDAQNAQSSAERKRKAASRMEALPFVEVMEL